MRSIIALFFVLAAVGAWAENLLIKPGEPPVVLTPAPRADQPGVALTHYRTPDGALVGVSNRILLRIDTSLDLPTLLQRHALVQRKVFDQGLVLVEVTDRSRTLDTVNRLIQEHGVIYAHPDFVRKAQPR